MIPGGNREPKERRHRAHRGVWQGLAYEEGKSKGENVKERNAGRVEGGGGGETTHSRTTSARDGRVVEAEATRALTPIDRTI